MREKSTITTTLQNMCVLPNDTDKSAFSISSAQSDAIGSKQNVLYVEMENEEPFVNQHLRKSCDDILDYFVIAKWPSNLSNGSGAQLKG